MLDKERLDDLLRDSRAADRIDRERAEAFQQMVASKGWAMFVQLIDARLQAFSDELLQPLSDMGRAGLQEYMKGAMWAFVLLRDLPANTIQAMKAAQQASKETDDE